MSKSDQTHLDQFRTALEIRENEEETKPAKKPNWEPQNGDETDCGTRVRCELCENTVSKQFARVFGDNEDNVINGCPECSTYREISGREDSYGKGVGMGGGL